MALSSPTKTSGLVLPPISSRSEHWATEHFLKSQWPIQSPGMRPCSYFKRDVCALCNENPSRGVRLSSGVTVEPDRPVRRGQLPQPDTCTYGLAPYVQKRRADNRHRDVWHERLWVCVLGLWERWDESHGGRKGKKIARPLRPAASSGSRPLTLHLQIKCLISLSSVRQANCHTCKSVHSDHCPNVLSLVSAFSFCS